MTAQFRWITVNDKFGNVLSVQENVVTGAAHRVLGLKANLGQYGVALDDLNLGNIGGIAQQILSDYADITKILAGDLTLFNATNLDNCWYLSFSQVHMGIPVYGADAGFTIEKDGSIRILGADIYPGITINTTPSLTKQQAQQIAETDFRNQGATNAVVLNNMPLLIFPAISNGRVDHYLVYEIQLGATNPTMRWSYFVDAQTSAIIRGGSILREGNWRIKGTVNKQYFPEHETDPGVNYGVVENVAIEIWNVTTMEASGQTNSSGYYDISWSSAYGLKYFEGVKNLNLSGSWVQISNGQTASHRYNFQPSSNKTHNWAWATDETNVFYHVDAAHSYWTNYPFYFNAMNYQVNARVNDGSGSNAWSDGTNLGFGTQYGQNWARFSDVIYHEYSHSVIFHIYGNFIEPNSSNTNTEAFAMDEGIPDYFACTINGDPIKGDGITGVPNYPRDIGTNWVRPTNWTNNNPHLNGRIIAGACWDMRESVMGAGYTDQLVYKALVRTPHADNFDEFADNCINEDVNLTGALYYTTIKNSFSAHGINVSIPPLKANFPPEGTDDTPKKFSLKQNYPNPFNPRTEIAFDLPQEEKVTLKIYDLYGREVVTLLDQVLEKGRHKISWNGSNDGKEALASGMYVYRIRAGDFIASKKLLLLR